MEVPLRITIPVDGGGPKDCCGGKHQHLLHGGGGFVHRPDYYCLCYSHNANTNNIMDSLIPSSYQNQREYLLHNAQDETPGFLLPASSSSSSPLSMSTCCALSSTSSHSPGRWSKWPRSRTKDSEEDIYAPSGISVSNSSAILTSSFASTGNSGSLLRKYNQGRGVTPSFIRKFSIRFFQIASVLFCALCIYTLVDHVVYLTDTHKQPDENNRFSTSGPAFRDHLQSWIIERDIHPSSSAFHSHSLPSITKTNRLLNLQDFHLRLNNMSVCRMSNSHSITTTTSGHFEINESTGKGIYFMILVHSAPDHFEERQAIRSTWGSIKSLKNFGIRLVFLLGAGQSSEVDSDLLQTTSTTVNRESSIFGDIVSGSFIDSYKNLTYKHLMGYKWALTYCPGATFILKTDDDAFIDIFQLFDFTTRTFGYKPMDTLVCNVFPEGTKPVRVSNNQESSTLASFHAPQNEDDDEDHSLQQQQHINTTTKWTVTLEEYPYGTYPKYCGGLAYIVTPDVLRKILLTSQNTKLFWIDDVYVTGILRELVGVEPFYLNLRYAYEPEEYRKWLDDHQPHHRFRKIPFMISHIERGPKYSEEMTDLWRKTLKVWS